MLQHEKVIVEFTPQHHNVMILHSFHNTTTVYDIYFFGSNNLRSICRSAILSHVHPVIGSTFCQSHSNATNHGWVVLNLFLLFLFFILDILSGRLHHCSSCQIGEGPHKGRNTPMYEAPPPCQCVSLQRQDDRLFCTNLAAVQL